MTSEEIAELPYMDEDLELEKRVEDLLNRMTLDEKIKIMTGKMFFFTKPIKRLGIKSFKMTDGPHGVGALGTYFKRKTTYFPVAICRAATWNTDLSRQFGEAVAEEVRAVGRHMLLGPGLNIHRTPFCGRTFEYQTEDPYLNAKLAVAVVKGIQSKRIAACVKHYVANNQEKWRFKVSSEIDERTLREIYLPAFEAAVKEANTWSVMACYNRVNGIHGTENINILKEKLIDEFGFQGFVVSDWFATKDSTTEGCMNAGLSLEMPYRIVYKKSKVLQGLESNQFSEETLNDNVKRILRVMFLVGMFDDPKHIPPGSLCTPEHIEIAQKIAEEGIVLLKNDQNILPLKIDQIKKIAILGSNATKTFAFGGGSSMIRTKYEITPFEGIKNKCQEKIDLVKTPSDADIAIIVTGLNHKKHNDTENSDRLTLDLPQSQIELIKNTAKENPKTIVILINGSPIAMDDWIDDVPAVIEAWYPGLESGTVIADILFGDVNPSGKLPITFPKTISDSPAHKSEKTYPGIIEEIEDQDKKKTLKKVFYEEGIFVGYRHFDKNNIEPLFPFGHGLSYTNFKYSNLKLNKTEMGSNDIIKVSMSIENIGNISGSEIIQLYIQDIESTVDRPVKELKGFNKVYLEPGKAQMIKFEISKKDLSFYDIKEKSWVAEKGKFKILIGASSRDIRLTEEFDYIG
ncbi:MAG: beta-glucosidase family protein [Candidatus Helarchaeota archaeon]